MSKSITKAFADYQVAITPKAVRVAQKRIKALGGRQSAADIRWSAAMALRDALDVEIAR
jgi:hypothetical protein